MGDWFIYMGTTFIFSLDKSVRQNIVPTSLYFSQLHFALCFFNFSRVGCIAMLKCSNHAF